MIRTPAPIPTIRIKFGFFPLFEVTVDVGDEGSRGDASAGDVALRGAAHKFQKFDKGSIEKE